VTESELAPRTGVLAGATLLALGAVVWSVLLWMKLADAQAGLPVTCALGSSGSCVELWDSAFARGIHAWSRLPVAGWGVLWSGVALLLPAATWLLRDARTRSLAWSGTVCTALAGLASVIGLLAVSAGLRAFCIDCALVYVLVGIYGVLVTREALRLGAPQLANGALVAALGAAAVYLVLLYPAARTPLAQGLGVSAPAASAGVTASPEEALASFLTALNDSGRQRLADALAVHRASEARPMRPPRGLIGSPQAPVRLTDFADLLCPHCAELNSVLEELRSALPAGSFSIEPRYFPLDGRCNRLLDPRPGENTRCVAAKVMICVAGRSEAPRLAAQLYAEQETLTPERVYQLAAQLIPGAGVNLRSCVDAPETSEQLRDDISWAQEHKIDGTPMVLLNGKPVPALAPLLYALILAGGNPDHPLFAQLPPAQPPPADSSGH
jgi:serine/threonine-protein kinase